MKVSVECVLLCTIEETLQCMSKKRTSVFLHPGLEVQDETGNAGMLYFIGFFSLELSCK